MDATTEHVCEECGADVSYYFTPDESVEYLDALLCSICAVQADCQGSCGVTDEQARSLNGRTLARCFAVLDMLGTCTDSVEIMHEIAQVGAAPETGLDVDLSEHHLTTGALDRVESTAQELGSLIRCLTKTLLPAIDEWPNELSYALLHHPCGPLVRTLFTRYR